MKQFSNFTLHLSPEIVFGKDTEQQVGALVKKHGGTKVMLVYGGGSIKKAGLFDRVTASLEKEGLSYIEFGGVQPNPRRSYAVKGIELAKQNDVDFLLAVGGGSTLDTAKSISFGMLDDDWWRFYLNMDSPEKHLPVGSIHTISAAGSETSVSTVLLDDIETGKKYGLVSQLARPVFAIMNPELTYSVSPYQTAVGITDILAHTVERYFTMDDSALGDEFAEGLMRTTVRYGSMAMKHPDNYEARAELMLCGSFSHNNVTGIGRAGMLGGPHGLEVPLSSLFDTAHGAGLAVVMPAWLELVIQSGERGLQRVAKFAINVFGCSNDLQDLSSVAYEGVDRFRSWLLSIGMPATLSEMGVKQQDIQRITDNGRFGPDGLTPGFVNLTPEQLKDFYTSIL